METIPELVEKLAGVKHAEINIQRMIRVLLAIYETQQELQERVRELENKQDHPLIEVKLKNSKNKDKNDTYSIDKAG